MILAVQKKSMEDMGSMLGIDKLFSMFEQFKIGMVGEITVMEQKQKTG